MKMFIKSIYRKLVFVYLSFFILSLSMVSGLLIFFVGRFVVKELKESVAIQAYIIADQVGEYLQKGKDEKALNNFLKVKSELTKFRILLIDQHGKIIASSTEMEREKVIPKAEVDNALAEEMNPISHMSRKFSVDVPVMVNNKIIGVLQLSRESLHSFPGGIHSIILIVALIIGGAVGLLILPVSKGITRPLKELMKSARHIAKGNFGIQVEVKRQDEIGELASAFNYMSFQLADASKTNKELIADISHELRSPLARIRIASESLEDIVVSEEEKKRLNGICEEVDSLDRLIGDLLELSKMELREDRMNLQPTDIGKIVMEAVARIEPIARQKGVNIIVQNREYPLYVLMDKERISQVLFNLLENALKATHRGCKINITLKSQGEKIEVSVIDDGLGMEEKELSRIFNRFYRIDKSRNRSTGGAGLGLAIARQIIEAHNGSIYVESEPGKGTKITFVLDAYKKQPSFVFKLQ